MTITTRYNCKKEPRDNGVTFTWPALSILPEVWHSHHYTILYYTILYSHDDG